MDISVDPILNAAPPGIVPSPLSGLPGGIFQSFRKTHFHRLPVTFFALVTVYNKFLFKSIRGPGRSGITIFNIHFPVPFMNCDGIRFFQLKEIPFFIKQQPLIIF